MTSLDAIIKSELRRSVLKGQLRTAREIKAYLLGRAHALGAHSIELSAHELSELLRLVRR